MPSRPRALQSLLSFALTTAVLAADPLPGTAPLDLEGDIASRLVDGVDRFLLLELERSNEKRTRLFVEGIEQSGFLPAFLDGLRSRLRERVGLREVPASPAPSPKSPWAVWGAQELLAGEEADARPAQGIEVSALSWPAFARVHGEGLLLRPIGSRVRALVIAIPDASWTPEQLAGVREGVPAEAQYARRLAAAGCLVVVPWLVPRERGDIEWHGRRHGIAYREFLYRSAYELGRHLIGYELQKVLSLVDGFTHESKRLGRELPIGCIGYGDGGLLALWAGALDARISSVVVSGYFEDRRVIWQQPIDRNVFGQLEIAGDAELAALVAPRRVIIERVEHPSYELPPGTGGAPATIETPSPRVVLDEALRAGLLGDRTAPLADWLTITGDGSGAPGRLETLQAFLETLGVDGSLGEEPRDGVALKLRSGLQETEIEDHEAARKLRQIREIDAHTQGVLADSPRVRQQALAKLDTSSLEAYEASVAPYRAQFRDEVIGRFERDLLPANARTRLLQESDKVSYFEVVLDVFPDVIAYGILCLPKGIEPGERRPVVVCQHGLEGRPQSVIGEKDYHYYKAFATRLAERGFVTFAPQNLYIFGDRFRSLQRKAYPLGKTLFSIIVPQHQQIVDWLETQAFVDPARIAFYGLSYGGKTAMRVPPLVSEYCLSICSADFNEWVDKNASTRNPRSYVWTGEYEIFEWDLGSTFNYAEMAALIAPRPFMVERGHFDGVADDQTVGHEFAKVRHLYQARLKIGDRCEIEWFDGPHTIHGVGTFRFLHRHLDWPAPK